MNLPELSVWGLGLWFSQGILLLLCFLNPQIVPNFGRNAQLENGIPANLQEMYEDGDSFSNAMLWLLEKNMEHYRPVRFLWSQAVALVTKSEPPNLRQYELSYLSYFQVIRVLTQEIIIMPLYWAYSLGLYGMVWWIYQLYNIGMIFYRMFNEPPEPSSNGSSAFN